MGYDRWSNCDHLDSRSQVCKHCEEKEQTHDEIKHFFEEIVKQLYSADELDKSKLEHCMDEICFLLQIKMYPNDLNVDRPKPQNIHSWIALQLNSLNK